MATFNYEVTTELLTEETEAFVRTLGGAVEKEVLAWVAENDGFYSRAVAGAVVGGKTDFEWRDGIVEEFNSNIGSIARQLISNGYTNED